MSHLFSSIMSSSRLAAGAKGTAANAANNVSFSVEEISTSDEDAAAGDDDASFFSAQDLAKTVLLDVGGETFKTTRASLMRVQGSVFEALASGRHANASATESASEYFIDRDPTHFRHILNYLRTGAVVTLPSSEEAKEELAIEADFYGLVDLAKAIKFPSVDVAEFLPPQVVTIQAEEKRMRGKYRRGHFASLSHLPFEKMIRLLGDDNDEHFSLPLMFNPDHPLRSDPSGIFLANLCPDAIPSSNDTPVTVKSMEEFETSFNKEFPNVLTRLRDILQTENAIVAGGAVLRALTDSQGIRTSEFWKYNNSDIDLFLYALPRDEANRVVRRIFHALAVDNERWAIVRSRGVINIHSEDAKVQIVLRIYSSPAEVLVGFDVDCCCCCYDGKNVWLTKRCAGALESGVNVLNSLHAWPNKPSYELRLGKYASRGFAVLVPGSQKQQIDYEGIKNSSLNDLKGLSRFVKVAMELSGNKKTVSRYHFNNGRHEHQQVPYQPTPLQTSSLSKSVEKEMTADEMLVNCRSDYDDGLPGGLLVPDIYDEYGNGPEPHQWFYMPGFPTSVLTRDKAIETIVDCESTEQDPPEGVPAKLYDAWITEKRSREYLNDEMDKYDLDAIYYAAAYKEEG